MRSDGRLGVVALVDRLVQGGAERIAAEIAIRLDPERFASTLCVTRWSDPGHAAAPDVPEQLRAAAAAAGVRFLGLARRATWDLAAWRPLVAHLRGGGVQVVHGHMLGSNVWAVVLGRAAGVPVVVAHEHSWSFDGRPGRRLLDRHLIARGSDAVIACSDADRRRMIEIEGIAASDVVLLRNGIDPRAPTPGRDVRRELGIAADAPVVGTVATLRPEKRLDMLLRAVALLRRQHPDVRVIIAGDGPERGRLEALVAQLGLAGAAMLLGRRADVPDVLQAIDVAANCSDFEGSPLSVLEYMEAARPVVAGSVGGLPELIEDGVHGVLVAPRDPSALANGLHELLADPQRRRRMGEAARRRRREHFSLDVMVADVQELYERLYRERRHGPSPS